MIPVIALATISAVYALSALPVAPVPAAVDYQFSLLIQVNNKTSTGIHNVAPAYAIGEAGGFWFNHTLDSYGIDAQHAPVYMDVPGIACQTKDDSCTIHVKSRTLHSFTLGDFFHIWGKDLGQNKTIDIPSNGSFQWEMCLGAGRPAARSTAWGALPLQSNLYIQLVFYDPSSGYGCSVT
jgi:hypothetical protein